MKVTQLLDLIQKKTSDTINQSMLAKALGVTRQTICNRIRNNSEITISELEKIEEFFGVRLFVESTSSDMIKVDYYPDVFASCGHGTFALSDEKELIEIHKSLFPINCSSSKKYSMIHAKGDSMSPYINNGDKLIIEHDTSGNIIDNKVYVFGYKSEIFVKRLSKNIDEIIVKSENPNYSIKVIKGIDMNEIFIIGQVVGVMRSI